MSVTVSNVKIVQCTICRWNPWTTNWSRHVWSRGPLILGHIVERWCFGKADIHNKHAGAFASGITTNPNDRRGTVTGRPAATTVGSTCGSVVSSTSRSTFPDTDTNLCNFFGKLSCKGQCDITAYLVPNLSSWNRYTYFKNTFVLTKLNYKQHFTKQIDLAITLVIACENAQLN